MTIKEIFETMDYGTAPESAREAHDWIAARASFGQFIDGVFTAHHSGFATRNPATGEELAQITQASAEDVASAVAAARRAQPGWEKIGPHARARHLYALARLIQKHARLLAVLETLDTGKPIREARDGDIPLAARHFYHHAGLAQLRDEEMPGHAPHGVCGQIVPWNFPLLMLAWKIAPALAMGNTVVLKPAEWTPLTALCFAELCQTAGLPKGVVNIVTGDGAVGEALTRAQIDKIAFTGSTEVGRKIREATAGRGIALTLELGGKSPFIVFDDADQDSAVEGLVDAIWFNGGQVCCAGSRLLVQEGIAEGFFAKIRARMAKLRLGDPLDKCIDMGAVIDPAHRARIAAMVEACDGEITQGAAPEGCFYPPTLITGLQSTDPLMQEEIFGPVLVATTFRTPAEAVALANDTRYGLAASLWSENVNLSLDIAPKLAAGVVWVNAANMFDAAAPFGGMRESGFGREGSWEGARAYLRPAAKAKPLAPLPPFEGSGAASDAVDRSAKLYIGGKQTRPDGGYSRMVYGPKGAALGEVPIANRKDLRNAAEAALKASSWSKTSGHARAQILYFLAENLATRSAEFAARIDAQTGKRGGAAEVEAAISRLFSCAAWADKFAGEAKSVPQRSVALAMRAPIGTIAALCPDESPLLGLVTLLGSALAMGNRIILAASEPAPLTATDLIQLLETSDVPAGVVNILTGSHADLAPHMAAHIGIDAIWSFSSTDLSGTIEKAAAPSLKRSWVNNRRGTDWQSLNLRSFLEEATEVQTIWVPYGA